MKNKGFTLIELLAVIVILAIIALIATPIVLGIIEDSKMNANKVSAQYMVDAVEKAYAIAYTKNDGGVPPVTGTEGKSIAEAFDMSGAEWSTTTDNGKEVYSVKTTDGAVVCNITIDDSTKKMSIGCVASDGSAFEGLENVEIGEISIPSAPNPEDPVEG